MEFQTIAITLKFFLVILMGFSCSSQAYHTFHVGGKDGWVIDPSENYIHWAERNRFQVNDSLLFKYKKGYDSVLEVNKEDFYGCKKGKPIQGLKDGESEIKLDRSGPFYFISGYADNCEKGQKLIVLVLSPRSRGGATVSKAPPSVAKPAPPPSYHDDAHNSPSPSPTPVASPSIAPYHHEVSHEHDHHHHAPAPAPSTAVVYGGGGSLIGFSLTVTVAILSNLF